MLLGYGCETENERTKLSHNFFKIDDMPMTASENYEADVRKHSKRN